MDSLNMQNFHLRDLTLDVDHFDDTMFLLSPNCNININNSNNINNNNIIQQQITSNTTSTTSTTANATKFTKTRNAKIK